LAPIFLLNIPPVNKLNRITTHLHSNHMMMTPPQDSRNLGIPLW